MEPVVVEIGPVQVHAYSVCMVAAVAVGGWLTYREAERRMRLTDETLMIGSIGLVGGVLGAKLSMLVFLGPAEFWRLLRRSPSRARRWTGALLRPGRSDGTAPPRRSNQLPRRRRVTRASPAPCTAAACAPGWTVSICGCIP